MSVLQISGFNKTQSSVFTPASKANTCFKKRDVHRTIQAGRDLRRSAAQPLAKSRVSYRIGSGCSGPYLVQSGLENLRGWRQPSLPGHPAPPPVFVVKKVPFFSYIQLDQVLLFQFMPAFSHCPPQRTAVKSLALPSQ